MWQHLQRGHTPARGGETAVISLVLARALMIYPFISVASFPQCAFSSVGGSQRDPRVNPIYAEPQKCGLYNPDKTRSPGWLLRVLRRPLRIDSSHIIRNISFTCEEPSGSALRGQHPGFPFLINVTCKPLALLTRRAATNAVGFERVMVKNKRRRGALRLYRRPPGMTKQERNINPFIFQSPPLTAPSLHT